MRGVGVLQWLLLVERWEVLEVSELFMDSRRLEICVIEASVNIKIYYATVIFSGVVFEILV